MPNFTYSNFEPCLESNKGKSWSSKNTEERFIRRPIRKMYLQGMGGIWEGVEASADMNAKKAIAP